jgi:hypothetical protein
MINIVYFNQTASNFGAKLSTRHRSNSCLAIEGKSPN